MLAAWYKNFGAAENVLETGEIAEPKPGKGEVKIKIHSSGVNPSDTKKRAGSNPDILDDGPIIPHSDGAGEVVDVSDEKLRHRIGEKVWVYESQHNRRFGTAAEFVCLPSHNAVKLPDGVSYDTGAMLGIPAMTAHRCVYNSEDIKDRYVLITGGAGRVGHYCIQWAKKAGAIVIATSSNNKGRQDCKQAGADIILSHPSETFKEEILELTKGQKIDKIIDGDFGKNINFLLSAIKPNSSISTYASMTEKTPVIPFYQMMNLNVQIKMVFVYDMPKKAKESAILDITKALKDNKLVNRLYKNYSLKEISQAHRKIENSKTSYGAVIVNPQVIST